MGHLSDPHMSCWARELRGPGACSVRSAPESGNELWESTMTSSPQNLPF